MQDPKAALRSVKFDDFQLALDKCKDLEKRDLEHTIFTESEVFTVVWAEIG